MRSPSGRSLLVSSVVSYGAVQLILAAGSVVRLPYLVDALGKDKMGLTIAVGNLAPLLLASTGGIRLASRTLIAEGGEAPFDRPQRMRALRSTARRIAWTQLMVSGLLAIALPLHRLLQAAGSVGSGEFLVTVLLTTVVCAGAIPGSASWGRLEAEGRIVLVNGLLAGAAVANVAATVALAPHTESFAVFTLLSVGASAAPFYLAAVVRPLEVEGPPDDTERGARARAAAMRAARVGTVQNAAPFALRAMDPVVVSARLGPGSAAELGVAQRIAMVTTLAPVAAGPIVNAAIARRRGAGRPLPLPGVLRLAAVYMGLAGLGGAVIVLLGPAVASYITRDEVEIGRTVFVALAILGVTSSAHNAFLTAGSGPSALDFALRLDVVSAVLNVILSVVLLIHWGLVGPIYASVVVTTLASLAWFVQLRSRPHLLTETHVP